MTDFPGTEFETYYGHNGQVVVRILPPTSTFIDDALDGLKYYFREHIFYNPLAWFLLLFVLMCLNRDTYVVSTFTGFMRNNLGKILKMLFFVAYLVLWFGVVYDMFTGMRFTQKIGNYYGVHQFWNQCERYLVSKAESGFQKVKDSYLEKCQRAEDYFLNTVEKWAHSVIDWVVKKKGERRVSTMNCQYETDGEIFYTPVGTPAPEQTSLIDLEPEKNGRALMQMSNINYSADKILTSNMPKGKMSPLTERQRLVKCFRNCGKDLVVYGSIVSENTLASVCPECSEKEMQGKSTPTNTKINNAPTPQQNNKISLKGTSAGLQDAVAKTKNMVIEALHFILGIIV